MSDVHVLCKIADAEYLLPADHVLQMESFSGATRVPGTTGAVAGLVQIRGRVVPVLDLRLVFGFPPVPPTLGSRVVVMQHDNRTVALLVDSAREVVTIPPGDFHQPPTVVSEQTEGFVKAVAQKGQRLLMLIDFTKVIGEEHVHE